MAETNISGYMIDLGNMESSTCGMIGVAQKADKKYFCKKFNNPVEPDDSGALSAKAIAQNRKKFEEFKRRKLRLNKTLREIAGLGGNIVFPIEETVYEHHWTEFTEFIDGALSEDQYSDVISGLDDTQKLLVLKIAIGALQTIHGQKIIHGDLKLTNIMLVKNNSGYYASKIIDFDGAFFENDVPLDSITGTVDYFSPELAIYSQFEDPELREKHSKMMTTKSDIFTMGLVLHEYLTGTKPKPDHLTSSLQRMKDAGKFIYPWQVLLSNDKGEARPQLVISDAIKEPAYVALISDMLNLEPDRRPSAAEVMERLNSKKLPIKSEAWPEDGIKINEEKAKEQLIGLCRIELSTRDKPVVHGYETIECDGRRYIKTAEELINRGLARLVDSWPPPRIEDNIEWNLEQLQRAFASIRPYKKPGTYQLYDKHGDSRIMTCYQLKMMNFARAKVTLTIDVTSDRKTVSVEQPKSSPVLKLWPEDEENWKLNDEALAKFHIKLLGRETMNGVKGFRFRISNDDEQFWTTQKCKMMNVIVKK